jgi:hypothetical protein
MIAGGAVLVGISVYLFIKEARHVYAPSNRDQARSRLVPEAATISPTRGGVWFGATWSL